jgi:ferredoxin
MNSSSEIRDLTQKVKKRAISSGAELVGIVSTEALDSLPRIFVSFWEYQEYTRKSTDFLKDARSAIILGYHAWDDVFEIVLRRGNTMEYPVEWRGRLFARPVVRYLEGDGYRCVLEPELLSKKRMAQMGGLGSFGKNTLIISPRYGPWIRLRSIVTDAELVPDNPFEDDLCGECEECIRACPVGALKPYVIDPGKCLLGIHPSQRNAPDLKPLYERYAPNLTKNSYLMCTTCQRACPYGRAERGLS